MRKKYNKKIISISSIIAILLLVVLVVKNSNINIIEEQIKNKEVTNVMASPSDAEYHTYMGTRKL